MLGWLIHFLQGPSANQHNPSSIHQYLLEQEANNDPFCSRIVAQKEAKRTQSIRDFRTSK